MKNIVASNPELEVIWYLRIANYAIDIIVVLALLFISGIVASLLTYAGIYGPSDFFSEMGDGMSRLVGVVYLFLYYSIMEITTQRTVGKYITGTMVINEEGLKPEPRSILGRSLCRAFSLEALSFLRAYPRGWHDTASGTYVVNANKLKEITRLKNAIDEIGTAVGQPLY